MATRVAVVTGAARGIGLEVCRQLGDSGFDVVLTARDRAGGAAAAEQLRDAGFAVRFEPLDVADPASVTAFAHRLAEQVEALDVLVNNAAGAADWSESALHADLDAAASMLATNLLGPWRCTQALLPLLLRSSHPRVVMVSSGAGSHGDTSFGLTAPGGRAAAYAVSKAALNALVAKLAAELAGTDVVVNAVCPGLTATWDGAEAMGARPVGEGAAGVVWAATLPDDGPRGGLFRDGHPLAW